MSAATTAPSDRPDTSGSEASVATTLGRALRAEWARLWSVRSTWWFVGATSVAVLGLGVLLTIDSSSNPGIEIPPEGAWGSAQFVTVFTLFGVLATAVVAATADHSTGGIVPTLQWTPRRGILLTARTAVITLTLTVVAVVLLALVSLTLHLVVPRFGLPLAQGAAVLGESGYVFATGILLAVGLGLLTRSIAGALVSVIALELVLPLLLALLPVDGLERLGDLMPGTSVLTLVFGGGPEGISTTTARIVLGAWAVGAMVLGGLRLARSDAGH